MSLTAGDATDEQGGQGGEVTVAAGSTEAEFGGRVRLTGGDVVTTEVGTSEMGSGAVGGSINPARSVGGTDGRGRWPAGPAWPGCCCCCCCQGAWPIVSISLESSGL